jgi:hypothetical protein
MLYFLWVLLVLTLTACGGGGGSDGENEPVEISNDEIVTVAGDSSVIVYLPANKEASEYVSYRLVKNEKVWTLNKAYLNSLDPGTLNFKTRYSGHPIVTTGEWSRALLESGASEFIGGLHGNEVTRSVSLNDQTEWEAGSRISKSTSLETQSQLYRHRSETILADILTTYSFDAERLIITQAIQWRESVDIRNAYLSMFPVERTLENGERITDLAYRSPDYSPEDVLSDKFPVIRTRGTREVRLEGSWSDLVFEISVNRISGIPEPDVLITNSPLYNKVYFDFASMADEGETWEIVTEYRISK